MDGGVRSTPECFDINEQLKSKKIKACTFKLSRDNNKIEVEHIFETSDPDAWKNWTSSLPDDDCRFGIYDVNMTLDMGEGVSEGVISKLVFLHWRPDEAMIKSKMLTSQAKRSFRNQFDGIQVEWQFCDHNELEVSDLIGMMSNQADIRTSGGRILTFENIKA